MMNREIWYSFRIIQKFPIEWHTFIYLEVFFRNLRSSLEFGVSAGNSVESWSSLECTVFAGSSIEFGSLVGI